VGDVKDAHGAVSRGWGRAEGVEVGGT